MRYVSALVAFGPLACGCNSCQWTWLCAALAMLMAGVLFVALSFVHELRLLAGFGRGH